MAGSVDVYKGACGHVGLGGGLLNGCCHEVGGLGMCGVGFDDDGTTGCEGAGGVASGGGVGEGEIAGSKYNDGAEGDVEFAEAGAWGIAVGVGGIDADVEDMALEEGIGVGAELEEGTGTLCAEAGFGEVGLGTGGGEEVVAQGFDLRGDGVHEGVAGTEGEGAVDLEGRVGLLEGEVDGFLHGSKDRGARRKK